MTHAIAPDRKRRVTAILPQLPKLYVAPEWLESLDRNPTHYYTDLQFLSLHANIAEAFQQRHIALLLGDNIEDIDGITLDWLIRLWNDCGQRFAIVLCAQMKPNATLDEPFADLWSYVSNNARE